MDEKSKRNLLEAIDLLKASELYVFVGAGLSCRAGLPRWDNLCSECVEEFATLRGESQLVTELRDMAYDTEPFCFTKLREDQDGKIALRKVFSKYFVEEKYDGCHKALFKLPFQGYITINYDKCLETACKQVKEREDLVGQRWFCFPKHASSDINTAVEEFPVSEIFNKEPFLLHLHGCFHHNGQSNLTNLVLDVMQYDFVYRSESMKEIVRELSGIPLLMLGTSFSDVYFRNMLYRMRGSVDENNFFNAPYWFLVLPESERQTSSEAVYSTSLTMKYIFYEDAVKEEDGLKKLIESLQRECTKILSAYVNDDIKVSESSEIK